MEILAQGIGFVGLLCNVALFQLNKRSHMLWMKILASIFFFIHYILLSAATGALMNVVAGVRTYIFKQRTKESWANNKLWLYFFVAVVWVFVLITWNGPVSLLPGIGMTLGTYAFWSKAPRAIRILNILATPCWFTYSFFVGSYAGMASDTITFISILTGIIRFDILKKKESAIA
ncbi:MAG: YgjV family protein [Candidatus Woesearchaeota archaeon]|nr:YgjV family protein [Candidatus Woesearchaeota archaeon]